MIACTCLVQEGQIPEDTEAALRQNLNSFTEKSFGAGAQINWIAVPSQGGFTAAKPSTSSLIMVQAPSPVAQETRAALLRELCESWGSETGQTINEIVGVISDPATA